MLPTVNDDKVIIYDFLFMLLKVVVADAVHSGHVSEFW